MLRDVAVGQNQWYHVGVGAPPILVYFSGDWDVHWGYWILTHGHIVSTEGSSNKRTRKARQAEFENETAWPALTVNEQSPWSIHTRVL